MNYGIIRYIVGKMLLMEGVLLLIPAFVSLLYGEAEGIWFLAVMVLLGVISLALSEKPKDMSLYAKEGFVIVAAAWVLWSFSAHCPLCSRERFPAWRMLFLRLCQALRRRDQRS